MNGLVTQWMIDRVVPTGMPGCAAGEPGGEALCQSTDEALCPPARLREILHQLGGPTSPAATDGLVASWHTWIFAGGKVRSVTRPDGWNLIMVVPADPAAAKNLDTLAYEFLALAPVKTTAAPHDPAAQTALP